MRSGLFRGYRAPLMTWAGATLAVLAIAHMSNEVLRDGTWFGAGPDHYVDGLVQYDGHRYLEIAADGYSYRPGVQSTIVWFPAYPLVIRAVSTILATPMLAAVLVTITMAGIALLLYGNWLALHESTGRSRLVALLALALSPYAWFLYGTVYADAMFLALALGALLLVHRGRDLLGGVLGGLALATRPTAIVLVPTLAALAAVRHGALGQKVGRWDATSSTTGPRRWALRLAAWLQLPEWLDRTKLKRSLRAPAIALLGLVAYAGYLWGAFGNPLIFLSNQRTFHDGRYPLLKGTFFSRMLHFSETPAHSLTLLLQALLTAAVLLTAGRVARRFGFPYAVLVVGTVAVTFLGTHDFMGAGRYMLAAFPAFAVWGERLVELTEGREALQVIGVMTSGVAMLVMAFFFSRGVYLS